MDAGDVNYIRELLLRGWPSFWGSITLKNIIKRRKRGREIAKYRKNYKGLVEL